MGKSNKNAATTIVGMLIVAAIIIGSFVLILNGNNESDKASSIPKTEVEKLLARDLAGAYPATPKEVVKLYFRINQSFYNEKLNEDQLSKMITQLRLLYDDELLANNPLEKHQESLKKLIKEYKEKERLFTSYIIGDNSSVEYNTIEDRECATIKADYTVQESGKYEKSYLEFILRKDESDHWRLLGWKNVEPQVEQETENK